MAKSASFLSEFRKSDLPPGMEESMAFIKRMGKDLVAASKLISRDEAKWLVAMYYRYQDFRMQTSNRVSATMDKPNNVVLYCLDNFDRMEGQLQKCLGVFAAEYRVGAWLQSLYGIGPVISAGLLSMLDVRGRPTAGHFWRHAGLLPDMKLVKREDVETAIHGMYGKRTGKLDFPQACEVYKSFGGRIEDGKIVTDDKGKVAIADLTRLISHRPWSSDLKTLCAFKVGESFVKFQEKAFYGPYFVSRKEHEWNWNCMGKNVDYCANTLKNKRYGADTLARAWYSGEYSPSKVQAALAEGKSPTEVSRDEKVGDEIPMIPPAQVHARARRWTVKLFLSHLHEVMYTDYYGEKPPVPYVFAKGGESHTHYIAPPNLPMPEGKSLRDLLVD